MYRALLSLLFALAALTALGQAAEDRIKLMANFRNEMTHYAIVQRADGRHYELYINEVALEAWRETRKLPSGAVFAIESFAALRGPDGEILLDADGRLIAGSSDHEVHLTMKSALWADVGMISSVGQIAGVASEGGTWRTGAFDPRTGVAIASAELAECHDCHRDHRAEDFLLSRGLLDRYIRTGTPAFITFPCSEREICFGRPAP